MNVINTKTLVIAISFLLSFDSYGYGKDENTWFCNVQSESKLINPVGLEIFVLSSSNYGSFNNDFPSYGINLSKSGCCSSHGGVCGCIGNRQRCCDGTASPSCMCGELKYTNLLTNNEWELIP